MSGSERAEGCESLPPLTYLKAYDSVAEARSAIGGYFGFYNTRRPHSSLARRTPDQAYFNWLPQIAAA
jgi:putative transposase